VLSLNIIKVDFIVVIETNKELLLLKRLACKPEFKQDKYVLFYDNQSAIYIRKMQIFI
jgi:hypothetical protein